MKQQFALCIVFWILFVLLVEASQHTSPEKAKKSTSKKLTKDNANVDPPITKRIKTKRVSFEEDLPLVQAQAEQPVTDVKKILKAYDKVKDFIENSEFDSEQTEMLNKVAKKLRLNIDTPSDDSPLQLTATKEIDAPKKSSKSQSKRKSKSKSEKKAPKSPEPELTITVGAKVTIPSILKSPGKYFLPTVAVAAKTTQTATRVNFYTTTVYPQASPSASPKTEMPRETPQERRKRYKQDFENMKQAFLDSQLEKDRLKQEKNKAKQKAAKKTLQTEITPSESSGSQPSYEEQIKQSKAKRSRAFQKRLAEKDPKTKYPKKQDKEFKNKNEATQTAPKKQTKVLKKRQNEEKFAKVEKSAKEILRQLQVEIGREHLRLKKLKAQIKAENTIFNLLAEFKSEKKIKSVRGFLFHTIFALKPSKRQMEKLTDLISMRK